MKLHGFNLTFSVARLVVVVLLATPSPGHSVAKRSAPITPLPSKPAAQSQEPPTIQVVSERTLPPELTKATDVRWASDRSVYLALRAHGVVEVPLGATSASVISAASARKVVPGREETGGFWYATLIGASPRRMVVGAPAMTIAAVDLETKRRRDEAFDAIHALDVMDDRLLILGMRRDPIERKVGTDGAIAWLGPVDRAFDDLKPVTYDATGPGIRNMVLCGSVRMGGVRFLADGRFVVVPGVQPGIQLYDRDGRLLRGWDSGELGIDSDCGALSAEESQALSLSIERREDWINRRRTVDSVLPLPEGPGLVVRSLDGGRLRWDLWVLKEKSAPSKHRLPIDTDGVHFHLRGDFRAGKMIFLLSEERSKDEKYPAPRLVIALPPA